ncbi:flagellar FliL protein [Loktanella fryxellensis]|uniref:Flagellar protein FliL n=1 Tax=Loktanella fryxellensis TaxID=245187 RepID=A0A1H7ZS03_9RHOB|nr:flagellar basal body-associated FliL family protein [Loktanella fryxellensis]SEM60289.1 flagellar FliL protein [Loktanella fryxellensis]
MTAIADAGPEVPRKTSKLPLIVGLVLAIAGAGGGFVAVGAGLLGGPATDEGQGEEAVSDHASDDGHSAADASAVAFIPLEPLVISLQGPQQYLRFTAQIEVPQEAQGAVTAILPRIVDVLNGYLRAVDAAELADPAALMRLRSQMLRRIQVVAGPENVRDLLIMEFVLN